MADINENRNQKLAPELLNSLQTAATQFDQVWDGLLTDGFTVDDYCFRMLKKMEPLEPGLFSVKDYLKENIKESFSNTYWSMRIRNSNLNGYRSTYLDWLEKQNKLGKWLFYKDFDIQPSLMVFRSLGYDAQDPIFEQKRTIRESINLQIAHDINLLKDKNPDFFETPWLLAKKNLTKILCNLLNDIGFNFVKIQKDIGAIVFSKPLPKSFGFISLCFHCKQWTQHYRWDVYVAITQEPVTKSFSCLGYPSMPIAFDFPLFSPCWRFMSYFLEVELRQDYRGVWHTIKREINDDKNKYVALYMKSVITHLDDLISKSINTIGTTI